MPDTAHLLRFVHISDTHINPDLFYNRDYARYTPLPGAQALVDAINALPFEPDFVLHTGDIAYDPVPEAYQTVRAVLSRLRAPVYYLAGNHDDSRSIQSVLMDRHFSELQPYLYYDFDVNGVQVVCLDSNGPHIPENPSGSVTSGQMQWLEAICNARDRRPLVVAVHHNVIPVGVPWLDDWMRMENGEDFHRLMRKAVKRLRGVFFGHIHQQLTTMRDGVLYVASASSWCHFNGYPIPEALRPTPDFNTPPGFSVVTVTADQTFVRRYNLSFPSSS
jgi:Icc protein